MRTAPIFFSVAAVLTACAASSTDSATSNSDLTLPSFDGGIGCLPGLPCSGGGSGSGGSGNTQMTEVTSFGSNPGGLRMFEHVPEGVSASPALLVVLHGCSQNAAAIAASGFNDISDARKFVTVYAQQSSSNNPATCFNWFDASDQTRGQDENASIKQMVDTAVAKHNIDPTRVFVAGFSAGAAQAVIMAATWPDVFAGAAPIAGIPYACTSSSTNTFSCQNQGTDKTPEQWAALVKNAFAGYTGSYPRVSVWQGTKDSVVSPKNRGEIVDQWTGVHGVSSTPTTTETVSGATHTSYADDAGNVVVESWSIPNMDHDVPVVPADKCGTTGMYAVDKGVCAAGKIADFFGL